MGDGALNGIGTDTRPSESRLEALKSWLAANDVQLSSKLEIRALPSDFDQIHTQEDASSFAIYAIEDIDCDEILAITPRSTVLSRRTCSLATVPAFQELCDTVEAATPQQAGVRTLTTALTCEILLGRESRWHGYIQSMPQTHDEIGLPTFWEDATASGWLVGTDIPAYMQQQKCIMAEVEEFYRKTVLPYLQNVKLLDYTSQDTFKLAFSLVLSRAFYVDNYHGLSMVPLADVFNHHFHPHATLQSEDIVCPTCGSRTECEHDDANEKQSGDVSSGHGQSGTVHSKGDLRSSDIKDIDPIEMVATGSVMAGEEVYNTYGKLDNVSLLVNYGFALDANEDDKVRWFSVASVLKQVDPDSIGDGENPKEHWYSAIKEGLHFALKDEDDRISQETLPDAHLRKPHELLFIDADGSVSVYLRLLLVLLRKRGIKQDAEAGTVEDDISPPMESLIRNRLQNLAFCEQDISELFERAAQPTASREAKLAISRVIDERLLQEACLAQWSQDTASSYEGD